MMNSIDNSQGTLAKLLAKENIRIQHGNYSTAFFDVKNRILGLPNWKNKGKDIYDLLCGHEVGHALYTPASWTDATCNKILLNIVEDARIERMVQNTYPGLISCFRRAYAQLHSEDFFGVKDRRPSTLNLPDRLNLKFKLGNAFDVQFSTEEQVFVDLIAAAQTWEDVLDVTRKLQDYLEQQPEPQEEQSDSQEEQANAQADEQDPMAPSDDESDETGGLDGEAEDDSDENPSETDSDDAASTDKQPEQKPESKDSDETGPRKESNEKPEQADKSADKSESTTTPAPGAAATSKIESETQRNFDSRANDLMDTTKGTLLTLDAFIPSDKEMDETIIPYSALAQHRLSDTAFIARQQAAPHSREEYKRFMDHTKKVVNNLVKEFELRKAAYQYSRSTVSKTGSLNVDRLHAFKTSDDIFLSVTKLADAKNHAMVMFVDYSGSMSNQLASVLNQVINMSLFCRRLGIPFKVYAFTSDNAHFPGYAAKTGYYMTSEDTDYNRILISNLMLLELVSSELSRTDFDDALYALFCRAWHGTASRGEQLGGTPLNEALIVAHKIVASMQAKYNPDRMIAMFLTDGSGNALRAVESHVSVANRSAACKAAVRDLYCQHNLRFKINGKVINCENSEMTEQLIRSLRETTKAEVIGFFVAPLRSSSMLGSHVVTALTTASGMAHSAAWSKWASSMADEYKKSDVLAIPGGYGYSKYFVVPNCSALHIDTDDELDVDATMSRSKITREFIKHTGSKKSNRVFVTKFAEALA